MTPFLFAKPMQPSYFSQRDHLLVEVGIDIPDRLVGKHVAESNGHYLHLSSCHGRWKMEHNARLSTSTPRLSH
jgi:hypothetical protein